MKKLLALLLCLSASLVLFSQPLNDNCSSAQRLCINQPLSGTTENATLEQCLGTNPNGCADDYLSVGIVPFATVWYIFTTNNAGGDATITISDLLFDTDPNKGQTISAVIFSFNNPCEGANYLPVSPEENGTSVNFSITAAGLNPDTEYYVLINGDQAPAASPAAASYTIEISGGGVETTSPTATISAINTEICQGESENIDITINNCTGTVSMNWYYNNAFIIDSSNFNTSVLSEDGYLKLVLSCGNECIYNYTTDSIYFDITPIFVDAGEDKLIELGETVVLDGTGIGSPVWSPSTGLSSTTTFTPSATPDITTTYFLTVTEGECTATDEVVVEIKQLITIPSGFTPNDDSVNDTWEIVNISQYPDNIVKVYDRSGQIVFETTSYKNIDNRWDGTFKGKPLPASTYYYFIDLKAGENSVFKGPVTIIR